MNKTDAIADAVKYVKQSNVTVYVLRRCDVYQASQNTKHGWKVAEMIGPGNVQNFIVNSSHAREHLPACGFLRSGKDQTACNCAQLLAALDELDAPLDVPFPFCAACNSWHHPNNPTCKLRTAPSRMTFKLEITLTDEDRYSDVTWMLQRALRTSNALNETPAMGADGIVRDANGNAVGKWEVITQ